jgi:hypothetical protein
MLALKIAYEYTHKAYKLGLEENEMLKKISPFYAKTVSSIFSIIFN